MSATLSTFTLTSTSLIEGMGGFTIPLTVTLNSSDVTRKIQISADGGLSYIDAPISLTSASTLVANISTAITNIKVTGVPGDTLSMLNTPNAFGSGVVADSSPTYPDVLTGLEARPLASVFGKGTVTIIGSGYKVVSTSDEVSWYSRGSSDSVANMPSAALFGKGEWKVGNTSYHSNGKTWVYQDRLPSATTKSGIIEEGTDRPVFFSGNTVTFPAAASGSTPTVAYETDVEGGYTKITTDVVGTIKNVVMPFQTSWLSQTSDNFDVTLDIDFLDESLLSAGVTLQIGLANSTVLTNTAYMEHTYNPVGGLKQGRNVLRMSLESIYWIIDGVWDWTVPVTHIWVRLIGTGLPAGTTIKMREVVTGTINVPTLCYGFDDAHKSAYPIFKYAAGLGVRGLVAVNGFTVGGATTMSLSQLKDLQSWGFTICNHTYNHTFLNTATYEYAYEQINLNKQWLLNNGFGFVPYLVWPGNACTVAAVQAALDLGYRFMRSHGHFMVPISAKYGPNQPHRLPSFTAESNTLAAMKTVIRNGIDNYSAPGIFYNHEVVPGNPTDITAAPSAYTWYDGWHRNLLRFIAGKQASGLLRTVSGDELIEILDNH